MYNLGNVTGDWAKACAYNAVAVHVTTIPDYYGRTSGAPPKYYGLGYFVWSRNGRYAESVTLAFSYMEIVRPSVEYDRVDGHLAPGVQATIYGVAYS